MMRQLGISFLGLFLWAISVVHAQLPEFEAMGEPRIYVTVCTVGNNRCSYHFTVYQNNKFPSYYIDSADCNSAQSNGYTFTRAPDDKSFYVQSACSGMSVDTLPQYNILSYKNRDGGKCMPYIGPTCRRKTTA
ncbi:hypothetical protein BCR42DRAFT_428541 [Absidia repens]|uniref:Uncharacterized protein n=1 Tax=Absidia repens TaxID=90262 RepID=A0A1X2HYH6_9FUNG|nr:hypothetical protein BCR42DRAFT_428541 [Absidia repens]